MRKGSDVSTELLAASPPEGGEVRGGAHQWQGEGAPRHMQRNLRSAAAAAGACRAPHTGNSYRPSSNPHGFFPSGLRGFRLTTAVGQMGFHFGLGTGKRGNAASAGATSGAGAVSGAGRQDLLRQITRRQSSRWGLSSHVPEAAQRHLLSVTPGFPKACLPGRGRLPDVRCFCAAPDYLVKKLAAVESAHQDILVR